MSTQENSLQVTVRPATHADCGTIKVKNKHLNGFDRFLYCFHTDVCIETKFTYVAEVANQIVAYTCGHVIDDGEVIVMREARVSDKYHGRNIIGKLDVGLIQAARSKFPNLKTLVWSSSDGKACQDALSRHPKMTRLHHKPVETFLTHSDKLKSVCQSEIFSTLSKKHKVDDIQGFPKREALKLLREEIRFLDFAPMRPMIGWQPSGWHASTLGNQLQVTDLFISRSPNTNKIQAFSFLTTTRADYGLRAEVEFYCKGSASSEDLTIAHLLHFIREMAILRGYTKIVASFMYPAEDSKECVKAVLDVHLGIPTEGNGWTENGLEYQIADALRKKSKL